MLRSSNIDEDTFTFGEDDVFVDKGVVKSPLVKEGDILITAANGSSRLVGKHTIIKDLPENSAIHGGFMLLASCRNPEFINSLMSSAWYTKFINLYVAGGNGAIGNLNKHDLDEQNVLVPSQKEQSAIGTFFSTLDQQITLHQRKLDKLKSVKQAYLSEMFPAEGERVPKRRFPGFTDAWELRKLNNIADVRDGTHNSPRYIEFGYPLVTSKNIKNGQVNFEDIQYISSFDYEEINKRSKVNINDILMGMIGTVGNLALVREEPKFAIKNVALIKNIGVINVEFLYHYLGSYVIERQLQNSLDGGTQKFISLNKIRHLDITFPTLPEQEAIGTFFSTLDSQITLHQRKSI